MTIETKPFDPANYLTDADSQTEYLRLALADPDPGRMAEALGTLARARGMGQVAEAMGLNRQALSKSLSPSGNPSFKTVKRVTEALGYKLTIVPIDQIGSAADQH